MYTLYLYKNAYIILNERLKRQDTYIVIKFYRITNVNPSKFKTL